MLLKSFDRRRLVPQTGGFNDWIGFPKEGFLQINHTPLRFLGFQVIGMPEYARITNLTWIILIPMYFQFLPAKSHECPRPYIHILMVIHGSTAICWSWWAHFNRSNTKSASFAPLDLPIAPSARAWARTAEPRSRHHWGFRNMVQYGEFLE